MEIPKKKNVIVTYVALFKVFKVTAFWKECPVFFLQFCTIYFIFKKDKKSHCKSHSVCDWIDLENGMIFGVPLRVTWTLVSSIQRYRHFPLKLSSAFLFFELSAQAL